MSKFASVHIATYGRSGSTLLMGLLNSIPGYQIRGENAGAVTHLGRFRRSVAVAAQLISDSPRHPWYNNLDPARIDAEVRRLYHELLASDVSTGVSGFKEIRYLSQRQDALFQTLDFIRWLDPPCAVVFNFRAHGDVTRSGFWARRNPLLLRFRLTRFERLARRYAAMHPGECYIIDHSNVLAGDDVLAGLFEFLGEDFDPQVHQSVLSVHHGYNAGGRNESYLRHNARRWRRQLFRIGRDLQG